MSTLGGYWESLDICRRVEVAVRLLPLYLRHLSLRPYRRGLPPPPGSAGPPVPGRWAAEAAFDTCIQALLQAYERLAGHRLRRETGQLVFLYMRLMSAFNREYEHRLVTRQSLALPDLLADPLIGSCHGQWADFATRAGAGTEIAGFLHWPGVAEDYARYVDITTRPTFCDDSIAQLEGIELDSGYFLAFLARLIGLFHGQEAAESVAEFHDFGMAGKLADELIDFCADHAEGRYNLLLAVLAENPAEQVKVHERLARLEPVPPAWWRAHAPRSFGVYMEFFENCYRRLRTPEMRLCCDASMIRATGGGGHVRRGSVPVHVSKPPASAWR